MMLLQRRAGASLAAVLALLSPEVPADEIRLLQADGSALVLEQPAQRIITLAPHLAELVYAAGAGDLLLATVEYSDFPEQAAGLPRIGDAFRFDMEQIMALKPDLVLSWQSGNPLQAQAMLSDLGLTLWQTEIRTPGEIADIIEALGRATGRSETAMAAADGLRTGIETLTRENAGKTRLGYFYQVADRPLYTVNGEHLISQGLSMCGANNVFAGLESLAPQISHEAVIQADPQVLMAPRIEDTGNALAQWLEWPQMQAVSNGALLYLPANEISRATPRLLDAIEIACNLLDAVRAGKP